MAVDSIDLPHRLHREVTIRAPRSLVFGYFADTDRWARWWGTGSTIEPKKGGKVYIRYPNAVEAIGKVLEFRPPERIVFSFGYVSGKPIPPDASRVTIDLHVRGDDTLVQLKHEFADEHARDEHVQGWRYQLSVFANVVADEVHAKAEEIIDSWFGAWAEPDEAARQTMFSRIANPDVHFSDRYSAIESIDDLVSHTGAAQRFLEGARLERRGPIRHCQGIVLADWVFLANGVVRSQGTNVFVFAPTGRIEWVTGFWGNS